MLGIVNGDLRTEIERSQLQQISEPNSGFIEFLGNLPTYFQIAKRNFVRNLSEPRQDKRGGESFDDPRLQGPFLDQ